jgi:ribosome maturation factor RimP
MSAKPVEGKVSDLVAAPLAAMGYDLVRVLLTGTSANAILQIMAEHQDGAPMTVDDCAAISRTVSEKLEADPALADSYSLEVSSPGIDRPLTRVKDYAQHQGHLAVVELSAPIEGRRRFKGKIGAIAATGGDNAEIEFTTDDGAVRVPMASIAKAKLVLTDELLKQAAGAA